MIEGKSLFYVNFSRELINWHALLLSYLLIDEVLTDKLLN